MTSIASTTVLSQLPWCYVLPVDDRAELSPAETEALERALARVGTLAELILWGMAQLPQAVIEDVVVQDEYTHDIVLPWKRGLYLVFDAT